MKIKNFLLIAGLLLMAILPVRAEQTTEGRDFWVTYMRAQDNKPTSLMLTFAAKKACTVTITRSTGQVVATIPVQANSVTTISSTRAQNSQGITNTLSTTDPYVADNQNDQVSSKSYHVTATEDISLIAANYTSKTFDVAAVLPTPTLLDDYYIQCYSPSDHEDKPQGSHFAVVAVENGTTIEVTPSVAVKGHAAGTTFTKTLQQGDVYYLWTEKNSGDAADLSGTHVQALNGKRIAVFNGNPHTNVPTKVRDRDHLYSQAVPTAYWGTHFAVTGSITTLDSTDASGNLVLVDRKRDKVRVMALYDGTQVYVNGTLQHTFDFVNGSANDKKHFYEFDFGQKVKNNIPITVKDGNSPCPPTDDASQFVEGSSCFIETSCPSAVHLFQVSNTYDYPKKDFAQKSVAGCNGDPAMIWINPIEQVIDNITFGVFETEQVKSHFVNVVTNAANVPTMTLDGTDISSEFQPLNGNNKYSFARLQIANTKHELKGKSGFIAHVYGTGLRESYGYPAGSAARASFVYVDDKLQASGDTVSVCYGDSVGFASYVEDFQEMLWDMADGTTRTDSAFKYMYDSPGIYDVECYVQRINRCGTVQQVEDTIRLRVNVNIPKKFTRYTVECVDPVAGQPLTMTERIDTIEYACDSIVYNYVNTYYNADTTVEIRAEDRYNFFGREITSSCTIDTVLARAGSGCDSTVHYNIMIVECLHVSVPENIGYTCPADLTAIEVPYTVTRGTFSAVTADFDNAAEKAGFKDGVVTFDGTNIALPIPSVPRPGNFQVKLTFTDDADCNVDNVKNVQFSLYMANILNQKWRDAIAIYNSTKNGGYTFSAYQWYRNDSILDGQTGPYLYQPGGLMPGSYYYVVLTCTDGNTYTSCPLTPEFSDKYPLNAPGRDSVGSSNENETSGAQKIIRNGRLYILRDGRLYDVLGEKSSGNIW